MATASSDPLLDLLIPHLPPSAPTPDAAVSTAYLSRLSSLPLSSIVETEASALTSSAQSLSLSLQSLSSRSHRALITSSHHLSTLSDSTKSLSSSLVFLREQVPRVDNQITAFTSTFQRDSEHLQQRTKSHLLSKNLDRLLDILQLPTLLQSLIASSSYPTALDLLSHVRRLQLLYPTSPTISSVVAECETLQKSMAANLVSTLRGNLKLPVAMKTIGFLRRCLAGSLDERGLRGLFLVCRRRFLGGLLGALEPLRELAEEERNGGGSKGRGGTQTERYLKRWIEVFREQSFGIVGMYKSIFPNALSTPANISSSSSESGSSTPARSRASSYTGIGAEDDPEAGQPPDPLAGFVLHLVSLLEDTLKRYLGNIEEKSVRESLLTQVLYAAGSMGRLGGEFGGILGALECYGGLAEEEDGDGAEDKEQEWVGVVGKHRVLASRLEGMVGR